MNTISQHILSVVETKREQLGMSKAELARRMDINPVRAASDARRTRPGAARPGAPRCSENPAAAAKPHFVLKPPNLRGALKDSVYVHGIAQEFSDHGYLSLQADVVADRVV